MDSFLVLAAFLIVATVAVGLARVLRGPGREDRLMAAQLLGSGSVAAILLLAVAQDRPALVDIALTFALLAAFASVAFAVNALASPAKEKADER